MRVLSVDDHPLLSEGIEAIINSQPDMQLVGSARTGVVSASVDMSSSPSCKVSC